MTKKGKSRETGREGEKRFEERGEERKMMMMKKRQVGRWRVAHVSWVSGTLRDYSLLVPLFQSWPKIPATKHIPGALAHGTYRLAAHACTAPLPSSAWRLGASIHGNNIFCWG